jgi:bifunctional non-homologous end joining protein LigD
LLMIDPVKIQRRCRTGRDLRTLVAASTAAPGRQDATLGSAATGSRFGSPLALSRVHWIRPEMVVEVSYAEWTL